ncbi:hypothetical protein [Burkholderia ubonensis]|uniref:hypothetical protein n=1 Tax=Burkholderia ubonensis TaxID=101571 RepID=UPI000AA7349D|nr:hypothetical protein [Burkholderia ubonensis]
MTSKLTAEQIVDAFNLAGVDFPRDRGNVSRLIAAVRALLAPTQQLSGEPSLNNPMVRFPTEEDIREWEEARKRQPCGEPASAGVTAAALAVIEADRAHVLTDDHVDALANAIKIQRGTLKLPEARAKLPRFPLVLRKTWSGGEVQHWIDENVAPRAAALRDALDHIARVARGSREQSRRQRWIELRALGALNGTEEWRTLPLPKNGETVRRRLMHTIDELRAENAELRALVPHTSPAVRAILAERRRRVEQEGWTPGHDDACARGELARASATYALSASGYYTRGDGTRAAVEDTEWPWAPEWWKPTTPRSDMVKSVVLGLSELERLDRTAAREGDNHAA